jgi:hypothetical protein
MLMKERNVWLYMFIASVILCLLISSLLFSRMRLDHKNAALTQQYLELRRSYINLAKDYTKDLNILARNEATVGKSWTHDHELPEGTFGEAIRRKIVRLELECEALEDKNPNLAPTPTK